MLRVLATGRAEMGDLVAVTFTEKAAGELKLRLRQALEEGRGTTPRCRTASATALEDALGSLEEAHIGTIHGFCADLLRERPVEAGVDPLFAVLTEDQARRLFDEAFAAWFQAHARGDARGRAALAAALEPARRGGDADADGPVDRLRAAGWELAEWRDFEASWARPDFDRGGRDRSPDAHACARLRPSRAKPPACATRCIWTPRRRGAPSDELPMLIDADDPTAPKRCWSTCAATATSGARGRATARTSQGSDPRRDVHEAYQDLVRQLDIFRRDADADLAALLRDELRGCLALYDELKTRRGRARLPRSAAPGARPGARARGRPRGRLQARFARIFVDEFQDTDPLQAELLLLLAADDPRERDWKAVRPVPGKLFIVGDPKQSIYRFRRADVQVYHDVCRQLLGHGAAPSQAHHQLPRHAEPAARRQRRRSARR